MGISDSLFEAEVAINDQLIAGYYGDYEDPIRQAIIDLLAHMSAVRMLSRLDQPPCEALHRVGIGKATSSDTDGDHLHEQIDEHDQDD